MQKLHESSYEEIEKYCQELVWQGLVNQGQQNTYPKNISTAVREIINLVAFWAVDNHKKREA